MLLDTLAGAAGWAAESKALDPNQVYCQAGHLGRDDDRDAGQLRPVDQRSEGGAGRLDAAGCRVVQDPGRLADPRRVVPAGLAGRPLPRLVLADECEPALRALDDEAGPAASCRRRCCTESGTRRTGAGNVPTNDMRWLELYARTRRLEDLLSATRPIWLGELRFEYERQAAELVSTKTPSSDPRWVAIQDWAARCAMPGKAEHAGKIADLQSAVELLAEALPGRFSASEVLIQELAQAKPRWSDLLARSSQTGRPIAEPRCQR